MLAGLVGWSCFQKLSDARRAIRGRRAIIQKRPSCTGKIRFRRGPQIYSSNEFFQPARVVGRVARPPARRRRPRPV